MLNEEVSHNIALSKFFIIFIYIKLVAILNEMTLF